MLLVIDVGNTNIVLGVYKKNEFLGLWRLSTALARTADEMGLRMLEFLNNSGIKAGGVTSAIISSVVPNSMYSLVHGLRKYFELEPLIVSRSLNLNIKLLKEASKELGADRIVNAASAYALYGGPVIIIDYGTATKYDVVDDNGEFITGVTAPGIKISADALFERAALLGRIELSLPRSVVAENTVESLQAGILYGHIGQTEYIVEKLKEELDMPEAAVVATGGLSRLIAQGTDIFDHINPLLTLEGLKLIHEMNA